MGIIIIVKDDCSRENMERGKQETWLTGAMSRGRNQLPMVGGGNTSFTSKLSTSTELEITKNLLNSMNMAQNKYPMITFDPKVCQGNTTQEEPEEEENNVILNLDSGTHPMAEPMESDPLAEPMDTGMPPVDPPMDTGTPPEEQPLIIDENRPPPGSKVIATYESNTITEEAAREVMHIAKMATTSAQSKATEDGSDAVSKEMLEIFYKETAGTRESKIQKTPTMTVGKSSKVKKPKLSQSISVANKEKPMLSKKEARVLAQTIRAEAEKTIMMSVLKNTMDRVRDKFKLEGYKSPKETQKVEKRVTRGEKEKLYNDDEDILELSPSPEEKKSFETSAKQKSDKKKGTKKLAKKTSKTSKGEEKKTEPPKTPVIDQEMLDEALINAGAGTSNSGKNQETEKPTVQVKVSTKEPEVVELDITPTTPVTPVTATSQDDPHTPPPLPPAGTEAAQEEENPATPRLRSRVMAPVGNYMRTPQAMSKRQHILQKEDEQLRREHLRAKVVRALMINKINERVAQIEEQQLQELSFNKKLEQIAQARRGLFRHNPGSIELKVNGRVTEANKREGLRELGLRPSEINDGFQPHLDWLEEQVTKQDLPLEEVTDKFEEMISKEPNWCNKDVRWEVNRLFTQIRIRPAEFIIKAYNEKTKLNPNVKMTTYVAVCNTYCEANNRGSSKVENRRMNRRQMEEDICRDLETEYKKGGRRALKEALDTLSRCCQEDVRATNALAEMGKTLQLNNLPAVLKSKVAEAIRKMTRYTDSLLQKIPNIYNFQMINISREPLSSSKDKEDLAKRYCGISSIVNRSFLKKNLYDVEVIDQEYWNRNETTLMKRFKVILERFPVISVDREFHGGFNCLGMIEELNGPVVFVFRMICPLKVRAMLADSELTTCGDDEAIVDLIGYVPQGFIDLPAFLLDLPSTYTETHIKTGVGALAKKFMNMDLEHIKTSHPEELRRQGIEVKNLERSFGGPIKIQGYVTKATYMYAALDPYVYIMCLLIIMKIISDVKIKNFEVHKHASRVGVVLEYLHRQMISRRKLDPRLIQNANISHEDKNFLDSKVALRFTIPRDVPSFYTLEQQYQWDMDAMQVLAKASWETLRGHREVIQIVNNKLGNRTEYDQDLVVRPTAPHRFSGVIVNSDVGKVEGDLRDQLTHYRCQKDEIPYDDIIGDEYFDRNVVETDEDETNTPVKAAQKVFGGQILVENEAVEANRTVKPTESVVGVDFEILDAFYNENYSIKHIMSLDRCTREATYVARMAITKPEILFDDGDTLEMAVRKQPGAKNMYNLYIRSNSISKIAYYEVMDSNIKVGPRKLQIGVIDKVRIDGKFVEDKIIGRMYVYYGMNNGQICHVKNYMLHTLINKGKGESCTLERLHTEALNNRLEYQSLQETEQEEEDKEERANKSSRRETPEDEQMDHESSSAVRSAGI